VLLVFGDADMIRPEHIVSFYQLLGGGLKGRRVAARAHVAESAGDSSNVTHYEMFMSPRWLPRCCRF